MYIYVRLWEHTHGYYWYIVGLCRWQELGTHVILSRLERTATQRGHREEVLKYMCMNFMHHAAALHHEAVAHRLMERMSASPSAAATDLAFESLRKINLPSIIPKYHEVDSSRPVETSLQRHRQRCLGWPSAPAAA